MAVVSDLTTDARVRREAESLAAAGHDVTVVGFSYAAVVPLSEHGVRYVLRPFPPRGVARSQRLFGAAVFFLRASRVILTTDADAYHAHNHHFAFPCLAVARRRRVHFVYEAHEMHREHAGSHRPLATAIERAIWRRADATITTNDYRRRYFEFAYGPPSPVVLANVPPVPHGMEPVDFRSKLGIDADVPVLLYQGGISHEERCFDAVARALEELPQWHWVLIGFGRPAAIKAMHRIIRESGLEDRAHLVPAVAADELAAYTANGTVGLIPLRLTNLNNYLGDTNKMFEYMMAGLPSVGSAFPEITRVLVDGPDGALGAVFDASDPKSIARAIRQAAAQRDEIRPRAMRVARSRFCWQVEQQKLVALYDQVDRQVRT
jgi:glycosyltransferase involved in cell wall biosynthesis